VSSSGGRIIRLIVPLEVPGQAVTVLAKFRGGN